MHVKLLHLWLDHSSTTYLSPCQLQLNRNKAEQKAAMTETLIRHALSRNSSWSVSITAGNEMLQCQDLNTGSITGSKVTSAICGGITHTGLLQCYSLAGLLCGNSDLLWVRLLIQAQKSRIHTHRLLVRPQLWQHLWQLMEGLHGCHCECVTLRASNLRANDWVSCPCAGPQGCSRCEITANCSMFHVQKKRGLR